ncbi:DUF3140 domain-containing protein [Streptomyces capparidis]
MTAHVPDELWQEFHEVVNMTSRELEDWLRTRDAGERAEEFPDRAGDPEGRRVLEILGKRRGDLTPADAQVMRQVVRAVRGRTDPESEPRAGRPEWRHRLMSLGHDPLKPTAVRTAMRRE